MRLEVHRRTLELAHPMQTAYGTVSKREIVTVALTGADGITGYGEACPLQPYDGVSIARVLRALSRYEHAIAECGEGLAPPRAQMSATATRLATSGVGLIEACRAVDPIPQALAAIDLALWDMAAKREQKPLSMLLAERPARTVRVNATISALERSSASAHAAEAMRAGFECVKVKVGCGDDAGRVASVRASIGPNVSLRLDANGAWSVEEAVRAIDVLSPAGLELVEEPTHGIEAIRRVRERVATRVAIDETAAEPGALAAGVADAVCLKISRCGGISGLLAAAALVRAGGGEVYVASTLDGPLGIAAGLHAAAALASNGPLPACGLATLSMFEGFEQQLAPTAGLIAVPLAAGLGVDPP